MGSRTKIATVILLDVGESVKKEENDGSTFFYKSQPNVSRIILRKIFSGDKDEITVVTVASEETDNELAKGDKIYQNISVLSPLRMATWSLHDSVEALSPTTINESNWVQGIVVALDVLKKQTRGKKVTEKQIILFTNFASSLKFSDSYLKTLVSVFNNEGVKLIVIGIDLQKENEKEGEDYLPGSMNLLIGLMEGIKQKVVFTFEEAKERVLYFEKKRKVPRELQITLDIGTHIKIPVLWVKFTTEEQIIKAEKKLPERNYVNDPSGEAGPSHTVIKEEKPRELSMVTDDSKITYFGATPVKLNYADLEALKRRSGPSCFTLIGCCKKERINPFMYVGENVYIVRPKPKSRESCTMLSAFVDALIKVNRVGIARRILTRDGKVNMGALIPVSDEAGKHLYFLKLPTREWFNSTPLQKPVRNRDNKEYAKAVDDFIDSRLLPPDLIEEGKGVLVYNPNFQFLCHHLAEQIKLKNPQDHRKYTPMPDYIKKLLEPKPRSASITLKRLNELFPKPNIEKRKQLKRKRFNIRGSTEKVNDGASTSLEGTVVKIEEGDFSNDEDQEVNLDISRAITIVDDSCETTTISSTQSLEPGY